MKEKFAHNAIETIQTTVGDLIEAITEIAMESGKSEQEGYQLASMTIERILNNRTQHSEDLVDLIN